MYSEITDDFIIYTLGYYQKRKRELQSQMRTSYSQLQQNKEDALSGVIYPSQNIVDDLAIQDQEKEWIDISQIYEHFKKLSTDQLRDMNVFLRSIVEEQESMNRVMAIYETLDSTEKDVLKVLYIDEPLRKLQASVNILMKKYACSSRTIYRTRRAALDKIHDIYNSDLTQSEIYRLLPGKNKPDCLDKKPYR